MYFYDLACQPDNTKVDLLGENHLIEYATLV